MQLPIVEPAPLVTTQAEAFRELFENRCQFQHFENYLTGFDGVAEQKHGEYCTVRHREF